MIEAEITILIRDTQNEEIIDKRTVIFPIFESVPANNIFSDIPPEVAINIVAPEIQNILQTMGSPTWLARAYDILMNRLKERVALNSIRNDDLG